MLISQRLITKTHRTAYRHHCRWSKPFWIFTTEYQNIDRAQSNVCFAHQMNTCTLRTTQTRDRTMRCFWKSQRQPSVLRSSEESWEWEMAHGGCFLIILVSWKSVVYRPRLSKISVVLESWNRWSIEFWRANEPSSDVFVGIVSFEVNLEDMSIGKLTTESKSAALFRIIAEDEFKWVI